MTGYMRAMLATLVEAAGGNHPRVYLDSDTLAFLQTQKANNTVRYTRVKSVADASVALGVTNPTQMVLYELGLMYQLTKTSDPTAAAGYAARCGVIIDGRCNAQGLLDLQGDSGYYYRSRVPPIVMGLDWCYDGLSVAHREKAATWLMDAADWVWEETNSTRNGDWAIDDPSNNYWWGFAQVIPAAIVASGDDTGTSTTSPGSGADRPAYHLALGATKLSTVGFSYFDGEGVGGGWVEGTGYDTSSSAGRVAAAFRTSGDPRPNNFYEDYLRFKMHCRCPDGTHGLPIGDQARTSNPVMFQYDRSHMHWMVAAANTTGALRALVKKSLDDAGAEATTEALGTGDLAYELMYYDPDVTAADDLSALGLSYYASGPGYFVWRESWTDADAVMFCFESGHLLGHAAKNCNGFRVWGFGDWISCDANIFSASGIEQATNNFNNLGWVGTREQSNVSTVNWGYVLSTQVEADLVAVAGAADERYGVAPSNFLTRFIRRVVYIPSKQTFICVDDVTATTASNQKVFSWHMKNTPDAPSGMTFKLASQAGTGFLYGEVFLQASAGLAVVPRCHKTSGTLGTTVLVSGGSGYAVNDTGTVDGMSVFDAPAPYGSGGTYTINTVDGGGAVLTYTLGGTQINYEPTINTAAQTARSTTVGGAQPGSGTGFTIYNGITSWAVEVRLPTGTANQVTLTTLQASATGAAPHAISAVSVDATNAYVTVGTVAVTIPLDGTSAVTVA